MSTIKSFLKYALLIIVFAILSELLISASLQSSYKDIKRKDNTSQVTISQAQAQATLVNGKIKGTIVDDRKDNLTGKYVKITLYSKRDNEVGKKYVPIETTDANKTQDFSLYFEKQDVTSYDISIVNEKEGGELELIPKEMTKAQIFVATLFTIMLIA